MKKSVLIIFMVLAGIPALTTKVFSQKRSDNNAPDDTAGMSVAPGKIFVYKQSAGVSQELEVYFPAEWSAEKRVPGVILFHGGSWAGGSLDQFRYACQYLAGRGLVAATANYRMIPKKNRAALPKGESYKRICITDAKSAIRWMKQHAEELGIDPHQLIAGGGSAGGHIAVLATTGPGLNDPDDPAEFDTSVAAYLLFNPAFQSSDSTDAAVDAFQHLKGKIQPGIFFFGDGDSQFMPNGAAVFKRFKDLGGKDSEFWIAEGQKHGFFNQQPWQNATLFQADRFLVKLGFLSGSGFLPSPNDMKLISHP